MFTFLGQCFLYSTDIGRQHGSPALYAAVQWREVLRLMYLTASSGMELILLCAVNASRYCNSYGEWSHTTDYGDCLCNCTRDLEGTAALEISIIIYLIGEVQCSDCVGQE